MPTSHVQDLRKHHLRRLWPTRERRHAGCAVTRKVQVRLRQAREANDVRVGFEEIAGRPARFFTGASPPGPHR